MYKSCYHAKEEGSAMSFNKELNSRLFMQREEQRMHVEYKEEFGFYENVAAGNMEAVKRILADPHNVHLYDNAEYGQLSKDSLRNMRYHFVVSVALITRMCVEKGLERELAYTLSDLYIGKMDLLEHGEQIIALHNDMLVDFTRKMQELPKQQVYSMQVVRAMDYVYKHRNQRLTVETIANALEMNRSYLSVLFKKETGESISGFIRSERIKAAANMLRFSDYTYTDIAQYFGFASQSHFIQCFRREMGCTPAEYRKSFFEKGEILAIRE